MRSTRRYELKRRAERRQETRRRIVQAAVDLHSTIGPARTTISAIAERAGVQRHTVYSHFPDERSLFKGCSEHARAADPPPDSAPWRRLADPEARLRTALRDFYGYYGRNEGLLENVFRDAAAMSVVREAAAPRVRNLLAARDVLARGWGVRGRRRARLLGALGHALEFETWRSLVRRQGFDDAAAAELMVDLVRGVARNN